jgi:DNA topoisomerase I
VPKDGKARKAEKGGKAAKGKKTSAKVKPAAPAKKQAAGRTGALVVVESPAKARTIKKYLGPGFQVKASVGHVKDLPPSRIGVDVEEGFAPEYVVIRGKTKVLAEIRTAARNAREVLLAPDPDREGEAIAWHIAEEIRPVQKNIHRILFNEITKRGIQAALLHPQALDRKKFESQQARRVLDRLVGYQLSPLLWNKVRRGLSAGRVQSVTVRLVVEREREIRAFRPTEYWTIECVLDGESPPPFSARLAKIDDVKAEIPDGKQAEALATELRAADFRVAAIDRRERRRFPLPPFITSRLQQEAWRKLRMSAKRTMGLAQRLYEGVELGAEGAVALITYMRTDSVRVAGEAVTDARRHIEAKYGKEFLPPEPIVYRSKKGAQDAHEAIRPTDMSFDPERVRALMGSPDREQQDLLRLYTLIWNRFIACQMPPAVYDQTTVDVQAGRLLLRATGQVLKFAGFTAVYEETVEKEGEQPDDEPAEGVLPDLREGQTLSLRECKPEQHFTQPPPRFSDASLIQALEEKGIGRPSTYAAILSTIQEREYVEKREGRFHPTSLGEVVTDLLCVSFPDVLNVEFTAHMEEDLDKVEDGEMGWVDVLREFYEPFKTDLVRAEVEMPDLKRQEEPTQIACDRCGAIMNKRWGKNGRFLACSRYPECRNTRDFTEENGETQLVEIPTTDEKCHACGSPMVVKRGRFGEFLACSRYPDCKTTKPISLGVACAQPGCDGFLAERRSRRGKPFYGCSNYGKTGCRFVVWDRPIAEPCPSCGAPFIVRKESRAGSRLRCVKPGCGWSQDLSAEA